MRKAQRSIIYSFAFVAVFSLYAVAWGLGGELLVVDRFGPPADPGGLPHGWTSLTFRKIPAKTRYTVIQEGDNYCLLA